MTYFVRGLLVVLLAAGGALAGAENDKEALKPFQGKWKFVRVIDAGKPAPAEKLATGEVFFEGDVVVISEAGINPKERKERVRFKIDPTKTPHTIDIISDKETGKKIVRGIYRFDDKGRRLTIALSHSVQRDRPTEFTSPEGANVVVMELERKN